MKALRATDVLGKRAASLATHQEHSGALLSRKELHWITGIDEKRSSVAFAIKMQRLCDVQR
jgi:hypothetical protein